MPDRNMDGVLGLAWDGGKHQVVYIPPDTGQSESELIKTIIHEAVHVLQHAIKYVEEDMIGKEFEAYATSEICMTLFAEYARQTGEKEKTLAVHEEGQER